MDVMSYTDNELQWMNSSSFQNSVRETVLKLSNSFPIAGHLGKRRTVRRILQEF